ncbi:MAG TPA: hypothetical protein DIT31_01990, partial [Methylophaga sp.]|nr:hypothetical protein [Methylophaga sp.]
MLQGYLFIDETNVTGTLMNRVYRIVWNASRQAWMVAAELTRGKTKSQISRKKGLLKLISSSLLVSTSLAYTGTALATSYDWNIPSGYWSEGANWAEGAAPDEANPERNYIRISNGGEAIVHSTIDLEANNSILYVGN